MPDSPAPGDSPSGFLAGLRQSRRFQDRPVPADIIAALLAAGRGEGDGERQRSLLVVDDLATRIALSRIGAFTPVLAQAPVAIVIVSSADVSPSKASDESRASDRIMLEAGRQGLVAGVGWFGTSAARTQAREILGLPSTQAAWGAVGVGYVEEAGAAGEPALDRVRRLLDTLSSGEPPADR